MSQEVKGMEEAWYPLALANQNEDADGNNITPFGVLTGREFNPPMFFPEPQIGQVLKGTQAGEETLFSLTPTEISIKQRLGIVDFVSLFCTHVVNDSLNSVPLFRRIGQIIPVKDRDVTLTFSLSQFVKRITLNTVQLSGNPAIVTERITTEKQYDVEVFDLSDNLLDSYSFVVYELPA